MHTSDWHLGKSLERHSLQKEQTMFLEELVQIAEEENVDMIVVAGDIFDTVNPPAYAEKMFYEVIEKLNNFGKRPVIIISGNHDHGIRLQAISPLAAKQGIFVVGTRETDFADIANEHFSFTSLDEGVLSFRIRNKEVIVLALPYLNERTIGTVVSESIEDEALQIGFETAMENILSSMATYYTKDSLHIIVGHFYIKNSQTSDEAPMKWGGAFDMRGTVFPKDTHYIAMGHMHRAQQVPYIGCTAYYAGSPMPFSKEEFSKKYVLLATFDEDKEVSVIKHPLSIYRPVVIWKADSIEKLLDLAETNKETELFVYVELTSDRPMTSEERKILHEGKPEIVDIRIQIITEDMIDTEAAYIPETIEEEFISFYAYKHNGSKPTLEVLEAFRSLLGEDISDEASETDL